MGKRFSTLALTLLLFAALAAVPTAQAQEIPSDIPDGDTESPADRLEDEMTERYRSVISRFYTGGDAAAAPALAQELPAYSFQAKAGLDLGRGNSMYVSVGVREFVLQGNAQDGARPSGLFGREQAKRSVMTLALGYGLGLRQFFEKDTPLVRRSVVEMSAGATMGDVRTMTVEIAPQYVLPINAYWSVPVGVKLGHALLGDGDLRVQRTFVGASIGVKWHHYGHRNQMK